MGGGRRQGLSTVGAVPVDREVAEPNEIARGSTHRFTHGVEHRRVQPRDPTASLADEVLAVLAGDEGVEPRPVSDVDMADGANLLEALQVAVDGGQLQRGQTSSQALGDVLGRDRPPGVEQRVEHQAGRGGHAMAGTTQRLCDLADALEGARLALGRDSHRPVRSAR